MHKVDHPDWQTLKIYVTELEHGLLHKSLSECEQRGRVLWTRSIQHGMLDAMQ